MAVVKDAGCLLPSRNPAALILEVRASAPPSARALWLPGHRSPSLRTSPSPAAWCRSLAAARRGGAGIEAFPTSDRYPGAWHRACFGESDSPKVTLDL